MATWTLLECPACSGVTLKRYYFSDEPIFLRTCIVGWHIRNGRAAITDLPIIGDIFDSSCVFLEEKCPNGNISFWLYNRNFYPEPYFIDPSSKKNLRDAPFSNAKELLLLIHGYTGHRDFSPNSELRPAYLNFTDYNIITVDWGKAAQEPCYVHAAYNIEQVSQCTVELLGQLYNYHSQVLRMESTHIVGFSLGAHVAGSIGKRFQMMFHRRLPRITGLDPALPMFDSLFHRSEYFLDKSDAYLVDVVHTNAGNKGRLTQVGHADFYVNNAGIQPGCISNASCDHVRAVELFAESISSEIGFWGIHCTVRVAEFIVGFVAEACTLMDNYGNSEPFVLMGEHINETASGTFLVRTKGKSPFAKGKVF